MTFPGAIDIFNHRHPDDAHETYDVSFFEADFISTTVTADPDAVTDWIIRTEAINHDIHRPIVGIDVEWRPYYSERSSAVAVVQICAGDRCLVYQIIHARHVPDALRDFFYKEGYSFVGVGVRANLEKLVRDYDIGRGAHCVELEGVAARECGINELKNAGLKELARFVLLRNVERPWRVLMRRWDERWLTAEQVQCACVDAYVSYEIGRVLMGQSLAI